MTDAAIDLHPQARQHFDSLAEALVPRISTAAPTPDTPTGFRAHVYVPDAVTPIGDVTSERRDLKGNKGSLVSSGAQGSIGLYGANYIALYRLAEAVQKHLSDLLTVAFVRDEIFGWLKRRHLDQTNDPMTTELLKAAAGAIAEHEIWMPVSFLYIQSPFDIGKVRFQTWDAALFEAWLAIVQGRKDLTSEKRQTLLDWLEKHRKTLQGTAAATISLTGESKRVEERALELADAAVGVLRLYADANYRADETSYCALLGTVHVDTRHVFLMEPNRLPRVHKGVTRRHAPHWLIRDEDLADFRVMGMDQWSEVLANNQRTPFQNEALSALLLYTRGALKSDLSDRLVYQFAGLESLLVHGEQEQLLQNIRERIAFTVEQNADRRAEVIDAVNQAYKLRSGFVHHGRAVQDAVTFDRFAAYGWRFFNMLAQNLHFPTTADFIKTLDRIKLT